MECKEKMPGYMFSFEVLSSAVMGGQSCRCKCKEKKRSEWRRLLFQTGIPFTTRGDQM